MTEPRPRSRLRVGIGAAVVLLLIGVGCAVVFSALVPRGVTETVVPSDGTAGPSAGAGGPAAASGGIFVHILGEVKRPGLYEVRDGDRAVDVVAAAGGFTKKADPAAVNLARIVSDGEQIMVPVFGEAPVAAPATDTSGVVNLNTADATALETLPGVGPATSASIIAWRDENGRFTAIEDLMSVAGIGPKTFDALKELVSV